MKTINIILLGILFVTTAIDLIPMVVDSKLSEFQKYAYVFYLIATISLFFDGEGASAFFWGANALISYLYGDGGSHKTYFILLGGLCIVWILYVLIFGSSMKM